jgi:hypothetical protein
VRTAYSRTSREVSSRKVKRSRKLAPWLIKPRPSGVFGF